MSLTDKHDGWRSLIACVSAEPEVSFCHQPASRTANRRGQGHLRTFTRSARQCLRFALTTRQQYGTWSGVTEDEPSKLHRHAPEDRSASVR